MTANKSSIQVFLANGLAAKEKSRLWEGLQKFANLGNSFEDFTRFAKQWPTFSPCEIRKGEPSSISMTLEVDPNFHVLVMTYRNYLRRVWISDPEVDAQGLADILLGLRVEPSCVDADFGARGGLSQLISIKSQISALTPQGSDQFAVFPEVIASWRYGDFTYDPLNDFQRAFYLLFRERWRARICEQCRAYFIADKPPTRYCSTRCYGEAKRKRSLIWWKRKGRARRKKQSNAIRKERKNPHGASQA